MKETTERKARLVDSEDLDRIEAKLNAAMEQIAKLTEQLTSRTEKKQCRCKKK